MDKGEIYRDGTIDSIVGTDPVRITVVIGVAGVAVVELDLEARQVPEGLESGDRVRVVETLNAATMGVTFERLERID